MNFLKQGTFRNPRISILDNLSRVDDTPRNSSMIHSVITSRLVSVLEQKMSPSPLHHQTPMLQLVFK